jgi:hypothetical protein
VFNTQKSFFNIEHSNLCVQGLARAVGVIDAKTLDGNRRSVGEHKQVVQKRSGGLFFFETIKLYKFFAVISFTCVHHMADIDVFLAN